MKKKDLFSSSPFLEYSLRTTYWRHDSLRATYNTELRTILRAYIFSFYFGNIFSSKKSIGSFHRKSPVDPATTLKSIETFRVCREFFADHFDHQIFQNKFCFRKDIGKIRKVHFYFFQKKKVHFYRNSDESTTFFTRILKATTYLDSSWKTASESVEIKTTLMNFIRSVGCSLIH